MAVSYGTYTITEVQEGSQIWTSSIAPTTPNYTFDVSHLTGDSDVPVREGDIILNSYYRYTVLSISSDGTTVLTGNRTSIRGATGAASVTYALIVSNLAIVKDKNGNLSPSTITVTAKSQTGSNAMANYTGRIKIETTTNNSTWTSRINEDAATKTYTIPSDTVAIRCSLYLKGGTTTLLDQQVISVVTDGVDGNDAYTVILTNENHTFAGNATSAIASEIECNVIAYKGTTQVAATIGTITGQSTGMTTSLLNNGTVNAAFKVTVTTSMVTKNGVLNIPITIDGKSFTKEFTYTLTLDGEKGDKGDTAQWYYGELLTHTSGTATLPISQTEDITVGAMYLNTKTGICYKCTAISGTNATWTYAGNITDGIEIGGRNLMLNTLYPDATGTDLKRPHIIGQIANTGGRGTCTVAEHGIRFTNTTSNWQYIYFGASSNTATPSMLGLEAGETYTLSADLSWNILSSETGKASTTTNYMGAFLAYSTVESGSWSVASRYNQFPITQADKGTDMSGRLVYTFTVPKDAVRLYLGIRADTTTAAHYGVGDYIEARNLKLEKGNKATDWTPAPEDVDEAIDNIEIGGRNLIRNSANFNKWVVKNGGANGDIWSRSVSGNTSNVNLRPRTWIGTGYLADYYNKTLTISFEIMSPDWSAIEEGASNTGLNGLAIQLETVNGTPYSSSIGSTGRYFFKRLGDKNYFKTDSDLVDGDWVKITSVPLKIDDTLWNNTTTLIDGYDYFTFSFLLRRNGTISFRKPQIEIGTKATDWIPAPEDVDADIEDARKVATNYLAVDNTGIMVADMEDGEQTPSTATGKNVFIDNDSVDVRNGQTVLSSFGNNAIIIGQYGKSRLMLSPTMISGISDVGYKNFNIISGDSSEEETTITKSGNFENESSETGVFNGSVKFSERFYYFHKITATVVFNYIWDGEQQTTDPLTLDIDDPVEDETGNVWLINGSEEKSSYVIEYGISCSIQHNGEITFLYFDTNAKLTPKNTSISASYEMESTAPYSIVIETKVYKNTSYTFGSRKRNSEQGNYSFTIGEELIASSDNQVAIGVFNNDDPNKNYAFMVGNGVYDENHREHRSNAFAVDCDGNVENMGDLEVGESLIVDGSADNIPNITINKESTNITDYIKCLDANLDAKFRVLNDGGVIVGNGLLVNGAQTTKGTLKAEGVFNVLGKMQGAGNPLFKVVTRTIDNISIGANSGAYPSVAVNESGYTPIAISGVTLGSASSGGTTYGWCIVQSFEINGQTLNFYVGNWSTSSAAKIKMVIKVLCIRTSAL